MGVAPVFPTAASTVAPQPSAFWGNFSQARPLPTNAPWQNFVLNNASQPEVVLPYSVLLQAANGTNGAGIQFGRPVQNAQASFIIQSFIADLLLTTLEGLSSHQVLAYDDMGVTLGWTAASSGQLALAAPLVCGSPYLTFVFQSGVPSTPKFSTIHAITSFSANTERTKYRLSLNNGQTWLIYASAALPLGPDLAASQPFNGVIRVALLPGKDPSSEEAVLDRHAPVYPTGGRASLGSNRVWFQWNATSWSTDTAPTDLLMLSLPVHRRLGVSGEPSSSAMPESGPPPPCGSFPPLYPPPSPPPPPQSTATVASVLVHKTLDGDAVGTVGQSWSMTVESSPVPWHSPKGISADASDADVEELKQALQNDTASLGPITVSSSYFSGKAIARAARLALIAEELGMGQEQTQACQVVQDALTAWFNGNFSGNSFLYDAVWGGVVPEAGSKDPGADFGAGLYNDHHFHYGYFVYGAAVLTKMRPAWGRQYQRHIYTLARDYMSLQADAYFPRLRHFDFYALHSWASGLYEFADGRNQESTSEAVNAYYAGALLGFAFNDLRLANLGATLLALEAAAAETLWHIPDTSTLYPAPFSAPNRVIGVLWANKRDAGLWFAGAEALDKRTGIQVLPVTPFTESLFQDKEFAQQLFNWTSPALSTTTDEWRGFVWALQAVFDAEGALENIRALTAFDDGNSRSNLLWFALSQQ